MRRGMTLVEVVIVVVILTVIVALGAATGGSMYSDARPRAMCQNNLKQMGLVFKMYASESKGELYPPMMGTVVDLVDCDKKDRPAVAKGGYVAPAPLWTVIYPEFISDPNVLHCNSDWDFPENGFDSPDGGPTEALLPCAQPDRGMRLVGRDYFYFGWVFDQVACGDDMLQFGDLVGARQITEGLGPLLAPWQKGTPAPEDVARLNEDINLPSDGFGNNGTGHTIARLKEGVERVLITDTANPAAFAKAQSELWIMSDRPRPPRGATEEFGAPWYPHTPGLANVLFMDGHVEAMRYRACADSPAPAPVNDRVGRVLATWPNSSEKKN